MNGFDWAVLVAYFGVMTAIGVWSHKRVDDVSDFFTAGGKMPWWLSGISHHMSGYSAVMFTGYAGIAYTYGITSYVTWALPIAIGVLLGAKLFAPRLNRLRSRLHVASPLEYLKDRYNVPTQQALAWSGILLKIVDVGAKWAAIATLLSVFTGVTLTQGILITGGITAVYCTIGGLWADALTELGQFVIQLLAGLSMLIIVLNKISDQGGLSKALDSPKLHGHANGFAGPYLTVFFIAYLFIKLFEYNGGMWNQAQRYMATGSAKQATKSAFLSAALWFVWPVILFIPMWLSPLLVTAKKPDGSDAYGLMTEQLLPTGCWAWSWSASSRTRWPCARRTRTRSPRSSPGTWPRCSQGRACLGHADRAHRGADHDRRLPRVLDGGGDAGQLPHVQGHHHGRHQVGGGAHGADRDPVHPGPAATVP